MAEWTNYRKAGITPMRPYVEGEDMAGISVNKEDTTEVGGMIAHNPENCEDQWYVAAKYFQDNYIQADKDRWDVEQKAHPKSPLGRIVQLEKVLARSVMTQMGPGVDDTNDYMHSEDYDWASTRWMDDAVRDWE